MVVHVMRDASKPFATSLRQADLQFGLTRPHLKNGKGIITVTFETSSFPQLLAKVVQLTPDLLILEAETDIPNGAVGTQLGTSMSVCGGHPAYIANWVSGEEREASTAYLEFIATHCKAGATR